MDWYSKKRTKQTSRGYGKFNICIYLYLQDRAITKYFQYIVRFSWKNWREITTRCSGVSYRNADAALSFLQNASQFLHEELIEKEKASSTVSMYTKLFQCRTKLYALYLGWMMDESTSRTTQKSLIVYVRYLDNFERNTSYYCLIDLDGNVTAQNILDSMSYVWRKDDINPKNTCWFASDNASTFTGE